MATAVVRKILRGHQRALSARFIAFRSHWRRWYFRDYMATQLFYYPDDAFSARLVEMIVISPSWSQNC
jgi:hypothetical protein